jgi:hypothetical protein
MCVVLLEEWNSSLCSANFFVFDIRVAVLFNRAICRDIVSPTTQQYHLLTRPFYEGGTSYATGVSIERWLFTFEELDIMRVSTVDPDWQRLDVTATGIQGLPVGTTRAQQAKWDSADPDADFLFGGHAKARHDQARQGKKRGRKAKPKTEKDDALLHRISEEMLQALGRDAAADMLDEFQAWRSSDESSEGANIGDSSCSGSSDRDDDPAPESDESGEAAHGQSPYELKDPQAVAAELGLLEIHRQYWYSDGPADGNAGLAGKIYGVSARGMALRAVCGQVTHKAPDGSGQSIYLFCDLQIPMHIYGLWGYSRSKT